MATVRSRGFALTNRVANTLLVAALRSPAGSRLGRRLAVVEYRGRRSGRAYQLVTAYVVNGRSVRIQVGTPGRKTWWRNFEEPHPLRLRLAGADHVAVAQVVHDGGQVRVVADL
ncbi:hypothetical protein [Pengzhenrongella phosphoraccumulans]|uniref:hypothetical protein n=1 Tax=Pengzhenrongella phosphoraccumulans TaxID=3114394 RepID=UPI00388E9E0A